ncbi:MAG: DNA alkylation repair protein [Corynebacterium sp.]|uniref:DNA alkylation repair protein n=1 Tax=unclassified Corynebacterium TaxID=2624378 RepID=UPI0026488F1F|nr:DNA alkylation repair protein [Corynebacterium sp.]MDN5719889.1 DNA alkylation repair protein [Corynebacterium sp.]
MTDEQNDKPQKSAFKDYLSPELVTGIGAAFAAASPTFDRAAFENLALSGLADLELKARSAQIAAALAATLPASGDDKDNAQDAEGAADVVRRVLRAGGQDGTATALPEWAGMPVNDYVAVAMADRPDVALPLLADLTSHHTAEFAIRPFILNHYETTMAHLRTWVDSPDEHVRRLVSEGTRPRLPWAGRLPRFIADPSDALELLEGLVNDGSLYVRRSVANHLNDIAKDHPELALETARRWAEASTQGDFVVRHSLRTLIKRGDPRALAILGFDPDAPVELLELSCSPSTIAIGEATTLSFTLRADAATAPTRAAVDYVVHYQGARGPKAGKVFKLTVRDLPPGQAVQFSRRHAFAHVSIRTIHPGPHRIEVQVNGRVLGGTTVHVHP